MNKVRQDKIDGVRRGLLQKKTIKQAMMDVGYSEQTAKRGEKNRVVQEALDKNKSDLIKQGLTAEKMIEELLWIYSVNKQNYNKSAQKKDKSMWMKHLQASADTLAKHTLATKTIEETSPLF